MIQGWTKNESKSKIQSSQAVCMYACDSPGKKMRASKHEQKRWWCVGGGIHVGLSNQCSTL